MMDVIFQYTCLYNHACQILKTGDFILILDCIISISNRIENMPQT